ncbi:MAG TPA: LuxR C-terminal-related transcriptional regulator [Geminicoccaceae bacterium]
MASIQKIAPGTPMGRDRGDGPAENGPGELPASVPLALTQVAAKARAALDDPAQVERLLDSSLFPMFTADGDRRYLEVNRPARLLFRHTLAEMRELRIDDLTPPGEMEVLETAWHRLITTGSVYGHYEVGFPDDTRLDVVYWAVSFPLRARHLIVFAPATWSEEELAQSEAAGPNAAIGLTPRELEVLRLAARGNSAAGMGAALVIGESTVKTHLANIYAKLGVPDRAAAVATAIRLGLID